MSKMKSTAASLLADLIEDFTEMSSDLKRKATEAAAVEDYDNAARLHTRSITWATAATVIAARSAKAKVAR